MAGTSFVKTGNYFTSLLPWARYLLGSRRKTEPIVISCATNSYWPLLLNFLARVERLDAALPGRIGFVCLDRAIASRLKQIGAAPCLLQDDLNVSDSLQPLWQRRLWIARNLTAHGFGIIFSDGV